MIISCVINGQPGTFEVDAGASLLDMLRAEGLTGTKEGCGVGECGACTVLVDNVAVNSCLYLAVRVEGKSVRTVEGESANGALSPMQQALVDAGAVQCGFCTPGMVMAGTALVEEQCRRYSGKNNAEATSAMLSRDAIRHAMAGNLCRCTGYNTIVAAVETCLKEELARLDREDAAGDIK